MQTERIPVLIVTGELGAGKTRLLSRLLAVPGTRPTALLVNEFADIAIDHEIFASYGLSAVPIAGGCICCTVRGEVRRTLQSLLFARARGDIALLEEVVIETSGVADPVSLIAEFLEDGVLRRRFRLAGVLTVVDATASPAGLADHIVTARQIVLADRLVVSKGDLQPSAASFMRELVARLNPAARVDDACRVSALSDLFLPDGDALPSRALHAMPAAATDHTHSLRSCSIEAGPTARADDFFAFVERLVERCGESLLRLKGIARMDDHATATALVDVVRGRLYPAQRSTQAVKMARSRAVAILQDIPVDIVAKVAAENGMQCA
jgi:G3E family GTPase